MVIISFFFFNGCVENIGKLSGMIQLVKERSVSPRFAQS